MVRRAITHLQVGGAVRPYEVVAMEAANLLARGAQRVLARCQRDVEQLLLDQQLAASDRILDELATLDQAIEVRTPHRHHRRHIRKALRRVVKLVQVVRDGGVDAGET